MLCVFIGTAFLSEIVEKIEPHLYTRQGYSFLLVLPLEMHFLLKLLNTFYHKHISVPEEQLHGEDFPLL